MLFYPRSKNRPFHLGTFPLEILPRDANVFESEANKPRVSQETLPASQGPLGDAATKYCSLFERFLEEDPVEKQAPVPSDLDRRAQDVKGCAYFMDASQVGICRIPENAWLIGEQSDTDHTHAVVMLFEHSSLPEQANLAYSLIKGASESTHRMRSLEISACVGGHLRQMGFQTRIHVLGNSKLDLDRMAVLSGLCVLKDELLLNPFFEEKFTIAVISTDYELAVDDPLSPNVGKVKNLSYWRGINGAVSGRERARRKKRKSYDSRYPMETVKRVDRPTTLILDDEVPRVPKRAAFFERALQGDLGEKAQRERTRFSFKHPLSMSLLKVIRSMVPYQGGKVVHSFDNKDFRNPAENAKAIKSLSYFLGSDLTGICEIPRYVWYSHKENGEPIDRYHKYAVVMLIDQGYDTMEGASGDDWISGVQSMRGYLRGAEIAGVMGETLRSMGFSSRSQTNADSDVLHIPLVLWAGLGELSRIGELVLNPFVGPRFKSVVLTTDLPLKVDKPIDFGLQYFCENCHKCDRECPCDAIPHGPKVMFNGYEIWKPDVERCTRYRLTNSKGSACGRCMKTCPLNKVVDMDGALMTRVASWLGVNARFMKPFLVPIATWLDDRLGNGMRNPVKKWWFDHEITEEGVVEAKATNQRDIEPCREVDITGQKVAYYPADVMPAPDQPNPYPIDRKAALEAKTKLETPAEAVARVARGEGPPSHYQPTPPLGSGVVQGRTSSPYAEDP